MLIIPKRSLKHLTGGGGGGGGGLTVAYVGSFNPDTSTMSTVVTSPIAMGTVPAGALLVCFMGIQNSAAVSSFVYDPGGANITLTNDTLSPTSTYGIWSGVVPAGSGTKNFVITFGSSINFQAVPLDVAMITNQAHGVKQAAASLDSTPTITLGVTAGQILIAGTFFASDITGADWSTSTPAIPTESHVDSGNRCGMAIWNAAATSTATFSITPKSGTAFGKSAATYS